MNTNAQIASPAVVPAVKVKYCLYARKSTESDEKQALSIDSQVKEMLQIADRENLEIVDIRRESHSAKDSGERPVFNEILTDIRSGRYTGILTWAPDRLSRNAGDLGSLVDLMDQKALHEIRTYGQYFKNSPNEKFLLMILCSQAKLENDNKSINVKRGLRTRVEMGLWPAPAPTGYLSEKRADKKCQVIVDPERAPVIKQMFEKVAYEKWSGRKLYNWLKFELNFKSVTSNKHLTLSNVYLIIQNPFYYGAFEYPKKSGNWYTGKHEPLISRELFDTANQQFKRDNIVRSENKEFAFARLMKCGNCGAGITAQEKFKKLKNGSVANYIYYCCTRMKDKECREPYLREEELIAQLVKLADKLEFDEASIKGKFSKEVEKYRKFRKMMFGEQKLEKGMENVDFKNYTKYVLKEGLPIERRELLATLKSTLVLRDRHITQVQLSRHLIEA
jgi:DNA invertase Pin-like site-specific DNA recombinase